ncbi:MAG: hypothetical protein WCL27_01295 [Betaproteobacteria bacterium]
MFLDSRLRGNDEGLTARHIRVRHSLRFTPDKNIRSAVGRDLTRQGCLCEPIDTGTFRHCLARSVPHRAENLRSYNTEHAVVGRVGPEGVSRRLCPTAPLQANEYGRLQRIDNNPVALFKPRTNSRFPLLALAAVAATKMFEVTP